MIFLIKQLSFWGAVAASLILALKLPFGIIAYILFLISNIASIYLLKDSPEAKVISLQIWFFMFINVIGVVRWF